MFADHFARTGIFSLFCDDVKGDDVSSIGNAYDSTCRFAVRISRDSPGLRQTASDEPTRKYTS